MQNIKLEHIIGTNLFSDNPDICFISPLYSNNLSVISNGRKTTLEDSADYQSPLEIIKHEKILYGQVAKNLVFVFLMASIFSLFGSVITIGTKFLPNEPGYLKYMALQLSIFSAFLFGFINIFETCFSKRPWSLRCILNSSIIKPGREAKCNIEIAKRDLCKLLSANRISFLNERPIPYGQNYFTKIIKSINLYTHQTNIVSEYNKIISNINNNHGFIKCIASILIGVGIEIFTFIDVFINHDVFRTNLIISAIFITFIAIFLAYILALNRYDRAYIKLDSLLYLYSYMYLDMPFNLDDEKCISISTKENIRSENIEAFIEYKIYKLKESHTSYIFHRLVHYEDGFLKIYGLDNID